MREAKTASIAGRTRLVAATKDFRAKSKEDQVRGLSFVHLFSYWRLSLMEGWADSRVSMPDPVTYLTPPPFPLILLFTHTHTHTHVPIVGSCGRGNIKVPRRDRPAGSALQEE
jgi:hypothetical protein